MFSIVTKTKMTRVTAVRMVETAEVEGSRPSRTWPQIITGIVLKPGVARKFAMTTSSHEAMKANSPPMSAEGRICGSVILMRVTG